MSLLIAPELPIAAGLAVVGAVGFVTCGRFAHRPADPCRSPSMIPWGILMILCLGMVFTTLAYLADSIPGRGA